MGNNIGKSVSEICSSKYRQKFPDHAKKYATKALKTTPKTAF